MSFFGFGKHEEEVIEVPKKKDPNAWEFLEDEEDFSTYRRRVPGGWLVRTMYEYAESEALTFVPDADHSWRP